MISDLQFSDYYFLIISDFELFILKKILIMSLSSGACETVRQSVSSTKPGQAGFRKVASIGQPSPCPIPGLDMDGMLEMRVKEGTKIRNLLHFAISRLQGEGHVDPVSQVMFTGLGRAITKTITCAEIVKRKVQGLHQVSKLQYMNIQELWQNQEGERMNVCKTVPSIYILLSKEPLDPQELGYQSPTETNSRSEEREQASATATTRKRPSMHSSDVILNNTKRSAMEHDRQATPSFK